MKQRAEALFPSTWGQLRLSPSSRNFFWTLAPERFDANVAIHANGSYDYSYDGILIFVPALIRAYRAGRLEPRIEERLQDAAAQLRQEGFRSADYLGRGRYAVILARARAKGGYPLISPLARCACSAFGPSPTGRFSSAVPARTRLPHVNFSGRTLKLTAGSL